MSRKDYNEAARILSETAMSRDTRTALVARFVTMFADDNPRFSPSRFREAAHPETTVGDIIVTQFVVDDFDQLTDEEREALARDEYLRRKLDAIFCDGLNWHETAGFAVDAWRDAYFEAAS